MVSRIADLWEMPGWLMSELGHIRTSREPNHMSALPPKADIRVTRRQVCFGPDSVEKVLCGEHAEFLKATDNLGGFEPGGPRQPKQNRSVASYSSYEGSSCRSSLRPDLRENFAAAAFSTFSTQSASRRHSSEMRAVKSECPTLAMTCPRWPSPLVPR